MQNPKEGDAKIEDIYNIKYNITLDCSNPFRAISMEENHPPCVQDYHTDQNTNLILQ
jgi:hypothetical protein